MKNKINEEPAYTELSHIIQGYILLNVDVLLINLERSTNTASYNKIKKKFLINPY